MKPPLTPGGIMGTKVRGLITAPLAVFVLAAAVFLATLILVPSTGGAQGARVEKSMAALKRGDGEIGDTEGRRERPRWGQGRPLFISAQPG